MEADAPRKIQVANQVTRPHILEGSVYGSHRCQKLNSTCIYVFFSSNQANSNHT